MYFYLYFLSLLLYGGISLTSSSDFCKMDILEDIDMVLGFLELNYKDINLDGWFGFKIMEKFLELNVRNIIDKCGYSTNIEYILQRTKLLNRLSLKVSNTSDSEYVARVKPSMELFVKIEPIWRRLYGSENLNYTSSVTSSSYDEEVGDRCFQELVKSTCQISEKCFNIFLSGHPSSGYRATHEAMYMAKYKQLQCSMKSGRQVSRSHLEELINDVCLGMLRENRNLFKSSNMHIAQGLDLLFERVVICGGKLGFIEFFSFDALTSTRNSIDRNNGCIGGNAFLSNVKNSNVEKSSLADQITGPERKRDSIMNGMCSSHLLGTGVASLGSFFHYFNNVNVIDHTGI